MRRLYSEREPYRASGRMRDHVGGRVDDRVPDLVDSDRGALGIANSARAELERKNLAKRDLSRSGRGASADPIVEHDEAYVGALAVVLALHAANERTATATEIPRFTH